MRSITLLLVGIAIALAIAAAGNAVRDGLQDFRKGNRFVTVKGLAEREVLADTAIWTVTYSVATNDLQAGQEEMRRAKQAIHTYLEERGFKHTEQERRPLKVTDLLAQSYRPEGVEQGRYILEETIILRTTAIEKIDRAASDLSQLVEQGVIISSLEPPSYLYTKLNDIKPAMLGEAIAAARQAAQQFAKDADQEVGEMKEANQGVFEIWPRDFADRNRELEQRHKKVRIVATVTYYLDD